MDQLRQEYKKLKKTRRDFLPRLPIIQQAKENLNWSDQDLNSLYQTTIEPSNFETITTTDSIFQPNDDISFHKLPKDLFEHTPKPQNTHTQTHGGHTTNQNTKIHIHTHETTPKTNQPQPEQQQQLQMETPVSGTIALLMFLFGFGLEIGQKHWLKLVVSILPRDWIMLSMFVGVSKHIIALFISAFSIPGTPFKAMFIDRSLWSGILFEQSAIDNGTAGRYMLVLFCFICGVMLAEIWHLVDRIWSSMVLLILEKACFYLMAVSVIGEPNRSKFVIFTCIYFVTSLMQVIQEGLMAMSLITSKLYNMDVYVYGVRSLLLLTVSALCYGVLKNTTDQLDFMFLAVVGLTGIQLYKFYYVVKDWLEGEEEEYL